MSDRSFLLALRIVLVIFTGCALLFAIQSRSTMYEWSRTRTTSRWQAPSSRCCAGAYWKRASTQGALLSIVLGIGTWLGAATFAETMIPANLLGLFASVIGMLIGSLAPQIIPPQRARAVESAS